MRGGLVVILLTFACAAQKPVQVKKEVPYALAGQPRPKGVMRCHMERDTGSNFMERVCTYDEKAQLGDTTIDDGMLAAQRRALQHVDPKLGTK
jgi:hypothetical protein